MGLATQEGTANAHDVVQVYALTLGREPEGPAIIAPFLGCDLGFLLGVFFEGPEFGDRVLKRLSREEMPEGDAFASPPSPELVQWCQARLPLEPETAVSLPGARSVVALWWRLFRDPVFLDSLSFARGRFDPPAWAMIEKVVNQPEAFSTIGAIEGLSGEDVEGWAVDLADLDRHLTVEVWSRDRFLGATVVSRFRRDLQDRFGGNGVFGFSLALPDIPEQSGRGGRITLRDARSQSALAHFVLPPRAPVDHIQTVREQFAGIQNQLKALEGTLRNLSASTRYALGEYSLYRHRYASPAMTGEPRRRVEDLVVRFDASGAAPADFSDVLAALSRQTVEGWALQITNLPAECEPYLTDFEVRQGRLGTGLPYQRVDADRGSTPGVVVTLAAGQLLVPEALDALSRAFDDPGVVVAFGDEDRLCEGIGDVDRRDRTDPKLKPGYDADLLSQTPYVGRLLAFRADRLQASGQDAAARGPWSAAEVLLALDLAPAEVRHIARVLHTEMLPEPDADWLAVVQRHFADRAMVVAEPHSDILGALVPGAVRLSRPRDDVTAHVIVPTRDALDLLEPCVDSLLRSRAGNRTAMHLEIIDHESEAPETRQWLEKIRDRDSVSVSRFSGAFNWALMNNQAAYRSTADVLVFLNNDTVVLAPDWLDALCEQAMRPGIGIVGARLVYSDATLQHGGFVSRDRRENFLIHDGVGLEGSYAGYMGRYALARSTVAVTGACMAVRRDVFEALGGFDAARLPVEGSDVDLCFRAQTQGLKVLYEPRATLYHLESKTRGFSRHGDARRIADAAGDLIFDRWGEQFSSDPFYNDHFDRESAPFTRLRPPPS